MIKNGNYEFLDFESIKGNLKEVFVEYYGERNREEVERRIDSVVYIPYLEPEVIYDYYYQLMTTHKKELISEFCKLMDIGDKEGSAYRYNKQQKKELNELLWSDEIHNSPLVQCIAEGTNLEVMPTNDEEWRQQALDDREKAYRLFDLTEEDKFEKLQDIVRTFNIAIRTIEEKYPCDVFKDMKKYQENKVAALQMYLIKMSKLSYPFTEKDMEIINKPDFDFVDANNLDCNNILFTRNVGNPGFYYYFTSENQKILDDNKDINSIETILMGRLRYWALNLEGCEDFEFISYDELFGDNKPRDREDFVSRMYKELEHLGNICPDYIVDPSEIDYIEQLRELYADGLYSGCKFAKNINKDYQQNIHNPREHEWVTYLDNVDQKMDDIVNYVFFNESGTFVPMRLLENLIHELNHAVGRGDSYCDKTGKYAFTRIGLNTTVKKAIQGYLDPSFRVFDENIMMLEENCNERMALEISDMYISKFDCPFEESDREYRNQETLDCMYNYWDFLTDKFYDRYKEYLKEHRINNDYDMYFEFQSQPATKKENVMNVIKQKYMRTLYPDSFSATGILDYNKVAALGDLIADFKDNVLPEIGYRDLTLEEFHNPKSDKYKTLPLYVRDYIKDAQTISDGIFNAMIEDEMSVLDYQTALENGENPVRPNPVVATGRAIKRSATNTKDKVLNFVKNKFGKKNTVEITLTPEHLEDFGIEFTEEDTDTLENS